MAGGSGTSAPLKNTIVTACNSAYFWGAFLLVSSIRYSGSRLPIIVVTYGIGKTQRELLLQFENLKVIPSQLSQPHLNKATALTIPNTEYVTWLDADCIYVGNIDDLLIPKNGELQIRFRGHDENRSVFRTITPAISRLTSIPDGILRRWRTDVGERAHSRFSTQCVTNSFCIHRSQIDFLLRWQSQIEEVASGSSLVNHRSKAYFMSDESVLTSLLCFCESIPRISPYKLDNTAGAHLMHFGKNLKPWSNWRHEHLKYYDYLQELLTWLQENKYTIPDLPTSLDNRYRYFTYSFSQLNLCYEQLKSLFLPPLKKLLLKLS